MSEARDAILSRVAEALSAPTDPNVRERHGAGLPPTREGRLELYAHGLPPAGADHAARVRQFAQMSESLRTQWLTTPRDRLVEVVRLLVEQEDWRLAAAHRHALLDPLVEALGLPLVEGRELARADVGFTACDALVAQTGSVLLTARSAGGRTLSVLPPHHVVIATADQLVPHLPAAYDLLHQRYRHRWPSFITLITGPSRTGDIERILVLGAHGPRKLTVILIDDTQPQ